MGKLMNISSFNFLVYLIDISIEDNGLRFVFLKKYKWYFIALDNIKSITKMSSISFSRMNAFSLETRWLSQTYMIFLKKGWFTHKILITPEDTIAFENWINQKKLFPVD